MHGSGMHPNTVGAIVWGVDPAAVPLPGGGCLLLCDYVWGHTFQTDGAGGHSWGRSWPHWAIGHIYMQMGSVLNTTNAFEVRTTNCEFVQCF